jgi:DNA repair protein SbcD/Mre11
MSGGRPNVGAMRLLHTSDWHLGRSFHREDLLGAQAAFVDFLLETVRSESVDVVLVSGDVYDRALPPVDAVALCNDALRRLAATQARVVLISGNHDSARRLGFGADLIDAAGIHLRTDVDGCGVPVLVDDPAGGRVAFYGIPYLEPEAVRDALECEERGHHAVLGAAMTRVRKDLTRRPSDTRSVVLAHAFVTGGDASESERDISVGGVSSVPGSLFDGIDYTALGHLHGPQRIGEALRYSGSPLAYSFSEEHHRKGMWLVDLPAGSGAPTVELVPTPVPRPLARLRGTLAELLEDAALERHRSCYVQVTLTDARRPADAMDRLRARFPHVLVLMFEPSGGGEQGADSYAALVRGRSDLEVVGDFVAHVRSPAEPAETALLQSALAAVRLQEASV